MGILVINGSPKGKNSVTYQTVRYFHNQFPEDSFTVLHAGQRIQALEEDFSPAAEALAAADMLLFCYPVYTFLAPAQLHRFIRLMKESGIDLSGKTACQLTTSKHFYDVTAHACIRDNCADLGLRYLGGLSADMEDLLTPEGRKQARDFWKWVHFRGERGLYEPSSLFPPVPPPQSLPEEPPLPRKEGKTVSLVTCSPDPQLASAIAAFTARCPYPTEVFDLGTFPFAGGCLGCFRCAGEGACFYTDGFQDCLRRIQAADATVYAFAVEDHSMGSRFKLYDDRQFCNGHRAVTMGKPVGYIIRGDMAAEANLRMVLEARSEVGRNPPAGLADSGDAGAVRGMADSLCYLMETGTTFPPRFYGVGGHKIFRDLVYSARGLMQAAHQFYKAHGLYDFPQKDRASARKMALAGTLMRNKTLRDKVGGNMTVMMLKPYEMAVEAETFSEGGEPDDL